MADNVLDYHNHVKKNGHCGALPDGINEHPFEHIKQFSPVDYEKFIEWFNGGKQRKFGEIYIVDSLGQLVYKGEVRSGIIHHWTMYKSFGDKYKHVGPYYIKFGLSIKNKAVTMKQNKNLKGVKDE